MEKKIEDQSKSKQNVDAPQINKTVEPSTQTTSSLPTQTIVIEEKKGSVNTSVILMFIIVFLLGLVIGYLLSGPQLNTPMLSERLPFLK